MKTLFTLLFLYGFLPAKSQNDIHWSADYQLQLSDFRSSATHIGTSTVYTISTAAGFEFSFFMTNAEFLFTRHFNDKVNCVFNRNGSYIIANDTAVALGLLNFAQFQFDLAELYARKFRQRLYEEKSTFSGVGFLEHAYETIQVEYNERLGTVGRISDIGQKPEKLREYHLEVLAEIETLPDFCKTCKPPRKKKTK